MYRILIIEDDLMIAKMLAAHLEKWDYKVALAEDFKNVTQTSHLNKCLCTLKIQ